MSVNNRVRYAGNMWVCWPGWLFHYVWIIQWCFGFFLKRGMWFVCVCVEVSCVYLLVLIGCDGGEHGLREGEGAGAFPSWDCFHRG